MRLHCILASLLLLLVKSTNSFVVELPIRYLSTACYGTSVNRNMNGFPLYSPMTYILNGCFKTLTQQLCCVDYGLYEVNCISMCTDSCPNGRWDNFNTCRCNSGYSIVGGKCTPVCRSCTNGTCIAPNQCICNEGYSMVNNKCVAMCNPPCINGSCSEGGECVCFRGFVKSTNNSCEPFCDHQVIDVFNGKCIMPNTLRCNEGFRIAFDTDFRLSCTPKFYNRIGLKNCPPGFEQNGTSLPESDPVCDPLCANASCVGPNKCACLAGYEKSPNKDHVCTPTCEAAVVNCTLGTCVAPNICTCSEGYRLTTADQLSYCELDDELNVEEGILIPQCFAGYELGEGEQCIPVCQPECTNGTCSAPNTCECNEGFTITANGSCAMLCDPRCTNESGTCTGSECKCKDGYGHIDSKLYCLPVPQLCSGADCNDDYVYDEIVDDNN